jgi:hypothetical protein
MEITSPNFKNDQVLPKDLTCDGAGDRPELHLHGVPADAKSLAVIVDDPDAPNGTFTHWLLWNIEPKADLVLPPQGIPGGAVEGQNSSGAEGWMPSCPPPGDKEHHYHFKAYALSQKLDLDANASEDDLLAALQPHILEEAEMVGKYKR